ncbi:hypothetical protein QYE76_000411 [Lolium multiflorum]|uniref:Solute carrier family 35 member F1 n=1 Tax=Lolium multiflorum TaxID=4521 RepID=A0AAD8RLU3_LOLMU|nr:hypothetical protein QYE76_000411 [Lolium multiflorum]
MAGLVLVVFSDVHASDRQSKGPNPLKGDMLVFAGATLYAVSNVTEEYIVKEGSRVELMAMLGVFGAVISAIQICILEREELRSTQWNAGALLPFIGFALALFLFYSTVHIILKVFGATMLNLSILTSDMWAALIRIFAYHEKVDWMYFVAFAGTAIELVIYSYKGSRDIADDTAQVAGTTDEEAATENRVAGQVTDAGEDDEPASNSFQQVSISSYDLKVEGNRLLRTFFYVSATNLACGYMCTVRTFVYGRFHYCL